MSNTLNYQPHIDGLRALAVLVVILCHLNIERFSGGFVGVDVFFVISGYLISKIIITELQKYDSFDFSRFYLRRARRILPALLFTCALTLLVAYFVFSPHHYSETGASAVHAITSTSNFYFWLTSDYFSSASETKPFLHTWSLAVEEQFYLFWPLLLLISWKVKGKFAIISVVAFSFLVSLSISILETDISASAVETLPNGLRNLFLDGSSLAYYLTPFRVFEFAAGAAVIKINGYRFNRFVTAILGLAGIVFILYASLTFDEKTPFPHYNALLPVLGTVFLLAWGSKGIIGWVLSNGLSTFLGKISYSLYLVHWPIIVFVGYVYGNELSSNLIVFSCGAILLCALVSYYLVEIRFRQTKPTNNGFWFGLLASASILMLVSSNIWALDGWFWRLDNSTKENVEIFKKKEEVDKLYAGGSNCPYVYEKGFGPYCQTNPNSEEYVWLIGDSHARHLAYGLAKVFPAIDFRFYKNNCRFNTLKLCYEIDPSILNLHRLHKTAIIERILEDDHPVIIAQTWIQKSAKYLTAESQSIHLKSVEDQAEFSIDQLDLLVLKLKEVNDGRRIIVFGDVPRPRLPAEASPIDCLLYPLKSMRSKCSVTEIATSDQRMRFNQLLALRYDKINALDLIFINPFDSFCDKNNRCRNLMQGDRPVYIDNSHLSIWGSEYLIKQQYSKVRYGLRDYIEKRNYYAK